MYENFLNFIEKGPENYYRTLQSLDILGELSEFYINNPLECIIKRYDYLGQFTNIMFEQSTLWGKHFDEEPLSTFRNLCDKTLGNISYLLEITFLFEEKGNLLGSYSISNQETLRKLTPDIEDLWKNHECTGHIVNIGMYDFFIKKHFDCGEIRHSEEKKADLLNRILTILNHEEERRWLCGTDGYFFMKPQTLDKIVQHNLIAPREYYYQFL